MWLLAPNIVKLTYPPGMKIRRRYYSLANNGLLGGG